MLLTIGADSVISWIDLLTVFNGCFPSNNSEHCIRPLQCAQFPLFSLGRAAVDKKGANCWTRQWLLIALEVRTKVTPCFFRAIVTKRLPSIANTGTNRCLAKPLAKSL